MLLKEIAEKLELQLRGPGDVLINGLAGLESAGPDELSFLSNPRYVTRLRDSKAGAVILSPEAPEVSMPSLVSENPYLSFARAVELFYLPPQAVRGIHPTAWIADSAQIGGECSVGAHVTIGDGAVIGERAVIYPNVTIYPGAVIGDDFIAHSNSVVREYCLIGNRVILQNGAVIGADGFGFAPRADKSYYKIVQSGIVVLEDDVEIGANSCVDRSTFGESRIGKGTKLDNLVQIGHGATVGEHNVLAAQTGVAGSVKMGSYNVLAGQVGIAGHITIGDGSIFTAQTGVARSVKDNSVLSGTPEMDSGLWKKNYLLMHKFPEVNKVVKKLVKEVEELKKSEEKG